MNNTKTEKERIVIDTSIFVNPDVREDFGKTPTEAMNGFLTLAEQLPDISFYMPSSVFKELMHFVEKDKIPTRLLTVLHQKSPSKHELTCPAILLYELIEDIRDRVNKGLRFAEKAVRSAGKTDERTVIQGLRKNYREALREGVIDSKEDVDLILLAKELDALLVTADKGAINWAEKMGVRWLMPERFKEYLITLIEKSKRRHHAEGGS